MAIQLRWVGEDDYPKIAQTRHRCYGAALQEAGRFQESVTGDPRAKAGDFLLAEERGEPVGTLTSLSLNIWMRGAQLPCQGIAWVGTIKTRRRTGTQSQAGIATQLMHAALDKARDRSQPVTALMPFRASFYEHFGYGLAEQRADWTIPIGLLGKPGPAEFRFFAPDDLPKLIPARRAEAKRGQCDIDTDLPTLQMWGQRFDSGWCMVHQPDPGRSPTGYVYFTEEQVGGQRSLRVVAWCCAEPSGLLSMLCFLGTLKDQYSNVLLTLPADVPLTHLIHESQLPHRFVDHPYAQVKPCTRMQIRILDHKRVLEALTLPGNVSGGTIVGVRECEGKMSTFRIEIESGRAGVKPVSNDPQFTCTDRIWSSLVAGHLSATQAVQWGLAEGDLPGTHLLDALSEGPAPFCQDYF